MLRFAINVSSAIQNYDGLVDGRENSADGGTVYAVNAAQSKKRESRSGTGISGAQRDINDAFFLQTSGNRDSRIFFVSESLRGDFIHRDHLTAVEDFDV